MGSEEGSRRAQSPVPWTDATHLFNAVPSAWNRAGAQRQWAPGTTATSWAAMDLILNWVTSMRSGGIWRRKLLAEDAAGSLFQGGKT